MMLLDSLIKPSHKMIEIALLWGKMSYFQLCEGNFRVFVCLSGRTRLSYNNIIYIFLKSHKSIKFYF